MKDIFLVDADETLLDFRRAEHEQFFSSLREAGIFADEKSYLRFSQINDGLWKALERGETTRAKLVVERFSLLFSELGICADAKSISDSYLAGMPHRGYFLPGAREFLYALKARGRVYIVTNGSEKAQTERLGMTGIAALADGVFISERIGADKPSAAFADYTEHHIPGYERERAVWIGDSLTSDAACAATRAIDFILYCRTEPLQNLSVKCARTYEELLALLNDM